MVGSEKIPFPSKPSSTGENNENDSNQDKMITTTKFQNNKKMAPKHFMSPTISAASKSATPRKKVLSERNDSGFEDSKRSYFDMSPSNRSSSRIVISSYDHHASEPNDNDDYVDDLSLKGYDPLRNYLSPRPKYLRFNPNRRHEIINRLEKQELDSPIDDSSKDVVSDEMDSAASKENVVKPKNEECEIISSDDYEEEEEEEEFQERGCCVRGVLKLVFTLVACFLSTSYICSMNSLSSSQTQSAIWMNVTDCCPMIEKQTLEHIGFEVHSSDWLEVGDNYSEVVDEVEIYEEENGETEENVESDIVEDNVEIFEKCDKEFAGVEDQIDEDAENEVARDDEIEYEIKNFEEMIAAAKATENVLEKEVESSSYLGLNEDKIVISVKSVPEEEMPHQPVKEVLELNDVTTDNEVDEVVIYDNEAGMEKMGWKISPVVVVATITSLILTLLGIIYLHSKKSRNNNTSAKKPEFVLKPHKFAAEKRIEFSARPQLSSHSIKEASGEINHHVSAPTVELIGEIVVGQMINLKISGDKMMTQSETQPISPTTQPSSAFEYSSNNSPSFGSFTTTERKIKKKERGQSGEAIAEVTPVRRSTRIRNRAAVTSP